MDPRLVFLVVAAAVVTLEAVRFYARRKVSQGRGRFAWLAFGMFIPIYGWMAWVALTSLWATPVLAVGMAAFAVFMMLVTVQAVARVSRLVHPGMSDNDRATAATALLEPSVVLIGVVLVGGLLLVVGLLVYAVVVAVRT